jgi:hypothetical protein
VRGVAARIPAAAVAAGVVAAVAAARVMIAAAFRVAAGAMAASTTPGTGTLHVCTSLASSRGAVKQPAQPAAAFTVATAATTDRPHSACQILPSRVACGFCMYPSAESAVCIPDAWHNSVL